MISYPKGNFKWNQLLYGSIRLSTLCPFLKNYLHVRTAKNFHQAFTWIPSEQA